MNQQLFEQGDQDASSHSGGSDSSSGSDSYRVIARRYRPSTFSEVIGQEHVTRTLKNAISEQRLGHAYLFSGPRGIGKTSTARILARAVNCEQGVSAEPCNECDICRELEIGSTPDIIEIDAASQRGIDDIRNLRETVRYSPLNSTYRVYIIDEAHMLSKDAFNAFLKTLEEPPDHVLFVFATTEPESMPETIISRCQPFQFKRIPHSIMLERLKRIVENEGIEVDESILSEVCRSVDGSLRDAQSVLDQLISISGDRIEERDLKLVLGTVPSEVLNRVLNGIYQGKPAGVLEQIHEIYRGGGEIDVFLDQFVSHLRDVLVVQSCGPDTDLIDAGEQEKQRCAQQAEWFSKFEISKMIQALVSVRSRTDNLYQSRLLLETALVRLCEEFSDEKNETNSSPDEQENLQSPEQVRERTEEESSGTDRTQDTGEAQPSSESSPPKRKTVVESRSDEDESDSGREEDPIEVNGLDDIREHWDRFLETLRQSYSTSAALLSEGKPVSFDGDTLVIAFPDGFDYQRNKLSNESEKEKLVEVMADVFHHNLSVEFVLQEDEEENTETEETSSTEGNKESSSTPRSKMEEDPDVRKVIESFDADIINVED